MEFKKTLTGLAVITGVTLGALGLSGCAEVKSEEYGNQGSRYEQRQDNENKVPEPSTIALFSTGAVALGGYYLLRKKNR